MLCADENNLNEVITLFLFKLLRFYLFYHENIKFDYFTFSIIIKLLYII